MIKKSLGIAILLLCITPSSVSAYVIASQTTKSYTDVVVGPGYSFETQSLGTGLSGEVRTVIANLGKQGAFYNDALMRINCFTTSAYLAACPDNTWDAVAATGTVLSETNYDYNFDMYRANAGGQATATRFEFDSSKYYRLDIFHIRNDYTKVGGNISGTDYPNGEYQSNGVTMKDMYFSILTTEAENGIEILDIQPTGGHSTIISNPVTYSASIHIPDEDMPSSGVLNVKMKVQSMGDLGTIQNPLYSGFGGIGPFGGFILNAQNQIYSHDVTPEELDASNNFNFSVSNSSFNNEIVVTVTAGAVASSTFVTIGATTTLGQLNSSRARTQADVLNTILSSTTNDLSSCGIGVMNLSGCTVALLYVQQAELNAMILTFFDAVAHVWPLGYATRFVAIISDTTASDQADLPALIDSDLPVGTPAAGYHLELSVFDNLLGAGSLLSSATNPNTGQTLREIVEPGWTNIVYSSAAIITILQILGIAGMLAGKEMATNERQRRWNYYN